MTVARFLDIHLLQTVPYANLNRDDLGSPKDLIYGGVTRTRVSSQCWKRAVRLAVEERLGDPALRTRRIVTAVRDRLVEAGWPADLAVQAGRQVVLSAGADGLKVDEKNDNNTSVLLYVPASAVGGLAELAEAHRADIEASVEKPKKSKKGDKAGGVLPADQVNALLSGRNGIINLFGRMLAELPSANVDGAVQVAHAFTTHPVETQVDFFTAVDDVPGPDHGSAHMNAGEFSAGVFYRYACVDLADLTRNLGGDTAQAIELAGLFTEAFITAIPQAKRTATAPHTVPDLVHLAVRADRPLSLAAAFERPVSGGTAGYAERSRRRLSEYATRVHRLLGDGGLVHSAHASIDDAPVPGIGERRESFAELVDGALTAVAGARQ
ncbi:MAG TPA: type I-E CRISPR-associated protein Cas7/Cse4/CasC [Mycobacteriales bacterium]